MPIMPSNDTPRNATDVRQAAHKVKRYKLCPSQNQMLANIEKRSYKPNASPSPSRHKPRPPDTPSTADVGAHGHQTSVTVTTPYLLATIFTMIRALVRPWAVSFPTAIPTSKLAIPSVIESKWVWKPCCLLRARLVDERLWLAMQRVTV